MIKRRISLLAVLAVAGLPLAAMAQTRADARLITATAVMQELLASPDQGAPGWLLERAYGVAVIPEVINVGFVFAGRHGNGVLTARDEAGRFSNPVFISLTGGSVGWQAGAQATDVVLIFATRRSVDEFAQGTFTLGGSAAVAAGPVGRAGEASAGTSAEIYSYSRTRGLFAGVALDGTALRFDNSANHEFYGQATTTADIIAGRVSTNSESARRFIAAVAASIPTENAAPAAAQASAPAASPATAATPATPATGAAAPAAAPAQTFPLEDAKPGAEPKTN